jgi:chromosome segregation ATPase
MNREDALLKRIEEDLTNDGYVRKNIYSKLEYGMGNNASYFQALVDRKLEGKEYPTAQEVWEEMKSQLNDLGGVAARASEDYRKLQNKYKNLEEHIKWLEKGKEI